MQTELRAWTIKDSLELYNVSGWGRDFFSINDAGHVQVTGYGSDATRCKVGSWGPNGTAQQVSVRCFTPAGTPAE